MNNKDNNGKWLIKKYVLNNDFILLGIFLLLVCIFYSLSNNFFTLYNLKTITINMSKSGLIVIGMGLVLIAGNIDLSVGSMIGLTSTITALIFYFPFFSKNVIPGLVGVILVMIAGGILGSFNAIFVVNLGLNSIITTLATLAIFRGLSYAFIGGRVLYINNPVILTIGRGLVGNIIPLSFIIMIILFFILFLFLQYTKFGWNLKATGADEKVAYTFGLKVKKIKFVTFIISGIMAGFTSIIICGQIGAGTPEFGLTAELDAIIIIVLGGASIKGGKGSALGFFIALAILEVFTNGFVLLGFSLYLRYIVRGLILILVLTSSVVREKRQLQL